MSARIQAAHVLRTVIFEGKPFEPKSQAFLKLSPKAQSRARHYCFSVLRHYHQLQFVLDALIKKPLKAKDGDLSCLLLIALYELLHSNSKPHGVVHDAVEATLAIKKKWAKGLVNATLRAFLRQKDALLEQIQNNRPARYSHPQWLIEKIQKQWPDNAIEIFDANNKQAPLTLRVNRQKTTLEGYQKTLEEASLEAQRHAWGEDALILLQGVDVQKLPHFDQGWASVQDLSAQLAADLLELEPGQNILDACAAPGGKTAHMLERVPQIQVTAVEQNGTRIIKLQETLQRIGGEAKVVHEDAGNTQTWWDGIPFDRILLDAPCTASGIIRRHPDIKLRCNRALMQKTCASQKNLLNALWPLLKHNGILVYSTCSIFREENVEQMEAFLQNTPDAQAMAIEAAWGHAQSIGRQILPTEHMDGFYYAKLIKR